LEKGDKRLILCRDDFLSSISVFMTSGIYKDKNLEKFFDFIINSRLKKFYFLGNGKNFLVGKEFSEYISKNLAITAFSMSEGSVLTCLSNDFGFDAIYEKYVDEYASSDDLIIVLKSSGAEENLYRAMKKAGEKGCKVVCLSGACFEDDLPKYTDVHIVIPTDNDRILYLCEELILESVFEELKNNNKG